MNELQAKQISVKPIASRDAIRFIMRTHYSGTVTRNSQLHLGAFIAGRLGGVMQFGPSMDKRKTIKLVADTPWNGYLELNRLAFADWMPRNSESRALSVAFRLMRKHYPHLQWIISFADATQCGDGTIYRAAGFCLTGIKQNTSIWALPDGTPFTDLGVRTGNSRQRQIIHKLTQTKGRHIAHDGAASMKRYREMGAAPLPGFQIRYIYFLHPDAKDRLTVPILPFSAIDDYGARMYKGRRASEAGDG